MSGRILARRLRTRGTAGPALHVAATIRSPAVRASRSISRASRSANVPACGWPKYSISFRLKSAEPTLRIRSSSGKCRCGCQVRRCSISVSTSSHALANVAAEKVFHRDRMHDDFARRRLLRSLFRRRTGDERHAIEQRVQVIGRAAGRPFRKNDQRPLRLRRATRSPC